jgi:hypothetical protein
MGTYTDLTVANYPLITSKSEVVPEAMTVFRETDRRVFTRRVSERNVLVRGEPNDPTDEKTEIAIEYSCETEKVIDRLNVMGFTLRRVQKEFETGLNSELEKFQSWAEDGESESFQDEWDFLKTLTFDQYANSFSEVISQRLRPVPFDDYNQEGLVRQGDRVRQGQSVDRVGFSGSVYTIPPTTSSSAGPRTTRRVSRPPSGASSASGFSIGRPADCA